MQTLFTRHFYYYFQLSLSRSVFCFFFHSHSHKHVFFFSPVCFFFSPLILDDGQFWLPCISQTHNTHCAQLFPTGAAINQQPHWAPTTTTTTPSPSFYPLSTASKKLQSLKVGVLLLHHVKATFNYNRRRAGLWLVLV